MQPFKPIPKESGTVVGEIPAIRATCGHLLLWKEMEQQKFLDRKPARPHCQYCSMMSGRNVSVTVWPQPEEQPPSGVAHLGDIDACLPESRQP